MSAAPTSGRAALVDPPLPYRMKPRIEAASRDVSLQQFVHSSTRTRDAGRIDACASAFGNRYGLLRQTAGLIKQHTLDHLDVYITRFVEAAKARGTVVHFAPDAQAAREIVLDLARRRESRLCVKSKSMVTEEIDLVPALEQAGLETVETDLGEFIVQLDDDAPSHIVAPVIHKDRTGVGRTFARELGVPETHDPQVLTRIARDHLRRKFQDADLGISGANFLIAETGSLVICTNEGNADLSVSRPPVHVAVVGIEKIIPSYRHLPIMLKLLARSATAQKITIYTTIVNGPRLQHEHGGADEVHVVLVDNGRSELLQSRSRELLRCIRCGACLNACPVYRKAGAGHAYGAVYSGPIGAVITPALRGLANYAELPQASSLCGACHAACPVNIDIPHHLVRLRSESAEARLTSRWERWAMRAWSRRLTSPRRYRRGQRTLRLLMRMSRSAPDARWIRTLPPGLRAWTHHRDFPRPSAQSFRDWWRENRGDP